MNAPGKRLRVQVCSSLNDLSLLALCGLQTADKRVRCWTLTWHGRSMSGAEGVCSVVVRARSTGGEVGWGTGNHDLETWSSIELYKVSKSTQTNIIPYVSCIIIAQPVPGFFENKLQFNSVFTTINLASVVTSQKHRLKRENRMRNSERSAAKW